MCKITSYPYEVYMQLRGDRINPKVSIILPSFNRAYLLPRAIKSILNQTFQDFELIIVDDGSSDNTEEVLNSFKDKRIIYIRHDRNKGASAARNTGLKVASGEYIAFQDSDDEWIPDKLEKQIKVFEAAPSEVGVVYTSFWKYLNNNEKIYIPNPKIKLKEKYIFKELLKHNFIGLPTAIIRKECFEKVGRFDEELSCLEDWDLFIRISRYYQFMFIDEPLLLSYYTPGSVNEQEGNIKVNALRLILQKNWRDLVLDEYLLARHYFNIGNSLCLDRKVKEGRKFFIESVKLYPLNIKSLLAFALSFGGGVLYKKTQRTKKLLKRKIRWVLKQL